MIDAYCLMTSHYHLLIATPEGNLPEIMRHINGAYTNYFNTKSIEAVIKDVQSINPQAVVDYLTWACTPRGTVYLRARPR